jgi:hypothetical protein
VQSPALKLTNEQFAAINGKWQGKLEMTPPANAQNPTPKKVSLNIALRFVTDKNGQYIGFLDSPDEKLKDIPMTEAKLENGELTAQFGPIRQYKGKLAGNALTGEWILGPQGQIKAPLNLTRQQ